MKQLLIFILFFSSLSLTQAQVIISGLVTEEESGEPLMSVTVSIKDSTYGTVTDLSGRYQLNLIEGEYILLFSYIGYSTVEKHIKVGGDSTIVLDISMNTGVVMNQTIIVTDGKYEKTLEEST